MRNEWEAYIDQRAPALGLDPGLVKRVVAQESGWNPTATSRAGAQGLMQLMPDTAADVGVTNRHDPYESLNGGMRYLAQQIKRFGSPELALAAYNAGPERVRQYGGVPPFPETQQYVARILGQPAGAQKGADMDEFDDLIKEYSNPAPARDVFATQNGAGGTTPLPGGQSPQNAPNAGSPMVIDVNGIGQPGNAPAPSAAPASSDDQFWTGIMGFLRGGQDLTPEQMARLQDEGVLDRLNRTIPLLRMGQAAGQGVREMGQTVGNLINGEDQADDGTLRTKSQARADQRRGFDTRYEGIDPFPGMDTAGRLAGQYAATAGAGGLAGGAAAGLIRLGALPRLQRALSGVQQLLSLGRTQGAAAQTGLAGVGARAGQGAGVGALTGGLTAPDDPASGAAFGGVLGAAGSLASDVAPAVAERGRMLRDFAANPERLGERYVGTRAADAGRAMSNIDAGRPDWLASPTGTQAAADPGVARFDDFMRNNDSNFAQRSRDVANAQNTARFQGLENMGANQGAIDQAVAERARRSADTIANVDMNAPGSTAGVVRAYSNAREAYPSLKFNPRIQSKVEEPINILRQPGVTTGGPLKNPSVGQLHAARQEADRILREMNNPLGWNEQLGGADFVTSAGVSSVRDAIDRALTRADPAFKTWSQTYAKYSKPVSENRALYQVLKDITGNQTSSGGTSPQIMGDKLGRVLKNMTRGQRDALGDTKFDTLVKLAKELEESRSAMVTGGSGSQTQPRQEIAKSLPMWMTPRGMQDQGIVGSLRNSLIGNQTARVNEGAQRALLDPQIMRRALAMGIPPDTITPDLIRLLSTQSAPSAMSDFRDVR